MEKLFLLILVLPFLSSWMMSKHPVFLEEEDVIDKLGLLFLAFIMFPIVLSIMMVELYGSKTFYIRVEYIDKSNENYIVRSHNLKSAIKKVKNDKKDAVSVYAVS
jgi:hypothetical protein